MRNRYSFTKLDNLVIEDKEISRTARAVFVILAKHSRVVNGSRVCYLHIKTIAQESQYAVRTVRYALRTLVDLGVIIRCYQFTKDGHNKASLFVVVGANAQRYAEDSACEATGTEDSTPVSKIDYPAKVAGYGAQGAAYNKTTGNNKLDSLKSVTTIYSSCPRFDSRLGQNVTQGSFRPISPVNCGNPSVVDRGLVFIKTPVNECGPMNCVLRVAGLGPALADERQNPVQHRRLSKEELLKMLQEKYCHNLDAAPAAWRPIVEFLLVRTGRAPAALSDDELNALQTLNANHTPARVLVEITKACERFERNGKPLTGITFCYIEAAMRNQKPTLRKKPETEKPEVRRYEKTYYDEHLQYDPASSAATRSMIDEKLAFVQDRVDREYKDINSLYPACEAEMMIFNQAPTQTREELFKKA